MKTLYLVGMAPPKDKKSKNEPAPCAGLTSLVALDPRHGVFPNLVMTPLLAAVYSLKGNPEALTGFVGQLDDILADDSNRRFNILEKPAGSHLRLSRHAREMLDQMDPAHDLWLVFGFWPMSAIMAYLVFGKTQFSPDDLKTDTKQFLKAALASPRSVSGWPESLPRTISAMTGVYFRLTSDEDALDGTAVAMLQTAVQTFCQDETKAIRAVNVMRSCIAFPHNEAYQSLPFGHIQNCFMSCTDPRKKQKTGAAAPAKASPPASVFWRLMGQAIRQRLEAASQVPVATPLSASGVA